MSTFVDFEDLKTRVKIEQTIPLLGLRMRQHAAHCETVELF